MKTLHQENFEQKKTFQIWVTIKYYFRKVLPLRWLRDHDRSSNGYNHKTFQRKVDTFSIDPNILKIKNIREENSVVHIKWDNDASTEYPASFLKDTINFDPKENMTTILYSLYTLARLLRASTLILLDKSGVGYWVIFE